MVRASHYKKNGACTCTKDKQCIGCSIANIRAVEVLGGRIKDIVIEAMLLDQQTYRLWDSERNREAISDLLDSICLKKEKSIEDLKSMICLSAILYNIDAKPRVL